MVYGSVECTNGVSPSHLQTMNHIVNKHPLTTFGLNLLHEAHVDAVIWLEFTATAALVK